MLKQLKRGLQICMVLAIILTIFPIQRILHVEAASVDTFVDVISFKNSIGYYAYDGKIFTYDQTTKTTKEVSGYVDKVTSLAYDGDNLYVICDDMSIYAYKIETKELLWKNESLKKIENQLGSALFLDKGILYVHAHASEETTILQLKVSDGTVVKTLKQGYRHVPGSLPYVSGENIVFSSSDVAVIKESGDKFIQLYDEDFTTSVLDTTSNQIFALDKQNNLYVTAMDETKSYLTLYKTKQSFQSGLIKATLIEETPVFIANEAKKIVLYFFNGVSFEKQDTNIATQSIKNIAFDNGMIYIVDTANTIKSASYTLPVKQNMNAATAQLQKDILTFYDSIKGNIKGLTLEKKATVEALDVRYSALTSNQQTYILASSILEEANLTIKTLQKNVDDINNEIAALSSPEEFKKEDVQKAIDLQKKYNALKNYDKTLIDQKLLRILDKVQAFKVIDEITALPTYANITIHDLSKIQEIAQHYEAVSSQWKKDVSNYAQLQRLENRVYELLSQNTLGDAYWSNFGGNKTSSATTNTKTPFVIDDVQSNFTATGNYQESIVVDNHIYTIRDKTYLSILDNKGNLIAETKLYSKIGFFSRLAYGDGKIYVPLNNRIQAFDAKTLRPLWLSQTGNQFISTVTYHNGYIYSGMSTGGGGDKGKTNGYFFAIKVEDEDSNNAFEVKDFTWTCGEVKNTGYYWAGAAIVGDAVVFAGDSGEVISHHLTQDIIFDRYLLGDTKVRANVSYIESDEAILVGTQDTQTLFKIKINENGSFEKNTIQKVNVGGDITGGVSNYNGRAYVPSGGMYAKGFSVVDLNTMQIAYKNSEVGSQSYPLISTAYATSENKKEVKIYILDYNSGDLRVLSDAQGQTVSRMETLAKGYGTYNSGSVTPDAYGNLYICGASFIGGGSLYSLQSKDAKFTITDLENSIQKFPSNFTYSDKKALQLLLNIYLSMSEGEQKLVKNADLLLTYERTMQDISDAKLKYIQKTIEDLPEVVSIAHQTSIVTALKEYGELLESDQLRIQNYKKLLSANDELQKLLNGYEQLVSDIDTLNLDTLTLSDQVKVNTLIARYEKLSEHERQYITNYDKLLQAQKILKRFADELEIPSLTQQVDTILQIGTLSLDNETQMMSLYKSIMNIDEGVRIQIVGYQAFLIAYESIIEQRALVDGINDAIWNQIQPLNIQLQDRNIIFDIYTRYSQLSSQNQAYVSYMDDLKYAKTVIDKMDDGYLALELFEKIKLANTTYTFETLSNGSSISYSFEGKHITKPGDFAFSMNNESIHQGAIRSLVKNAQILSFAHEGDFPGKATIRMQTSLTDGTYHLYYYNPIKKNAEIVQDIQVLEGMTTFELSHASTYFISDESIDPLKNAQLITPNHVNTGDNHFSLSLWGMLIISFGVMVMLRKKV